MSAISKMMKQQEYIRNVSIIAHVDHGKTSLTESLAHVHMDVGEEKDRGITIKSAAVSLQFDRMEYNKAQKQEEQREYLVNLIDSPGHVDFSSEVTAALRITDGAICVIDCIEGVKVQTETVLRQAILERVKPVLFLNKIDRIYLEKHLSSIETYKLFRNTIQSTNAICHTYKDEILGNIDMNPSKGNIAFGSGYFGFGFTLNDFAKMYSSQFGISKSKLCKKLWGNNYYNSNHKTWIKKDKMDEKESNGFCKFILEPLQVLHDSIMNKQTDIYLPIINGLDLNITNTELNACKKPKDVLKLVMSRWLPAKNAVLDLCADHLPSPVKAQKYRIPKLYTGPLETQEAQDMLFCNPNGKLSMYVSKMIPIKKNPGTFIAFGRVFSGTIKRGQELTILGQGSGSSTSTSDEKQNDDNASQNKATRKKVSKIMVMMGNKSETLNECCAGNVCGLLGIDKYLTKSGTLTDSQEIFPFKTMKFSVSPVVNVAVSVTDSKNLKKLVQGLERLSKFDNIIQIKKNKQGQQIVAGSGELHLQTCLKTLQEDFMDNVKIKTSNPIVSYCEGIDGISGSSTTMPSNTNIKSTSSKPQASRWSYPKVNCAKSPNKLNRIFISVEPLSNEVCDAIENDKIKLQGDMKTFGRNFAKTFGGNWHKDDAAKIWSFGCPPYGKPNILVDQTKSVDYLDKVKGSIIEGFRQITSGGILCDEPLRGVRFNIIDAKIHSDSSHHGPGQIIPATVRACYGAMLSAKPTLFEPMYQVNIEVPNNMINGVHNTLGMVRGVFDSQINKADIGIPLTTIKAYVPIVETLKNKNDDVNNGNNKKEGFTQLLSGNTKGKAFAVMKFSHWKKVNGDPLINNSISNKFVMQIRKRKKMKNEIPSFTDYYDKI